MFIKLMFMIYMVVNNISVLIIKTKKIISSLNVKHINILINYNLFVSRNRLMNQKNL